MQVWGIEEVCREKSIFPLQWQMESVIRQWFLRHHHRWSLSLHRKVSDIEEDRLNSYRSYSKVPRKEFLSLHRPKFVILRSLADHLCSSAEEKTDFLFTQRREVSRNDWKDKTSMKESLIRFPNWIPLCIDQRKKIVHRTQIRGLEDLLRASIHCSRINSPFRTLLSLPSSSFIN